MADQTLIIELLVDQTKAAAALKGLETQTVKTGKALKTTATTAKQATARGFRNFGYAAQQASVQTGDFFIQVQGGQDVFRAFSQQATQVAGFFMGPWGIALTAASLAIGFFGEKVQTAIFGSNEELKEMNKLLEEAAEKTKALENTRLTIQTGMEADERALYENLDNAIAELNKAKAAINQPVAAPGAPLATTTPGEWVSPFLRAAAQADPKVAEQLNKDELERLEAAEKLVQARRDEITALQQVKDAIAFQVQQEQYLADIAKARAESDRAAAEGLRKLEDAINGMLPDATALSEEVVEIAEELYRVGGIAAELTGVNLAEWFNAGGNAALAQARNVNAYAAALYNVRMNAPGTGQDPNPFMTQYEGEGFGYAPSMGTGYQSIEYGNAIDAANQKALKDAARVTGGGGGSTGSVGSGSGVDESLKEAEKLLAEINGEVESLEENLLGSLTNAVESTFGLMERMLTGQKVQWQDFAAVAIRAIGSIIQELVKMSAMNALGMTAMGANPGVAPTAASPIADFVKNLLPFASGGIVTGPTSALIGEAGPEAVVPLTRGAGGKLGLAGGGTNVTVNNYTNSDVSVNDDGAGGIELIINAAVGEVTRQINRGGPVAQGIERNYGVGRKGR